MGSQALAEHPQLRFDLRALFADPAGMITLETTTCMGEVAGQGQMRAFHQSGSHRMLDDT